MARASATIDLSPTRIDFKLVRGDTWKLSFFFPVDADAPTVSGFDLTGSTWDADIKLNLDGVINPDSTTPIVASFDIDTTLQEDGSIYLTLEEDVTRGFTPGEFYWFDLEQHRNGDTATPIQGRITVLPDVTIEGA